MSHPFQVPEIPDVLPLGEPLPETAEQWKDAPGLLDAFNQGATIWRVLRPGMLHVRVSGESWVRPGGLCQFWQVWQAAGVDPSGLKSWPGTAPAYSYLAVIVGAGRSGKVHRALWFFREEQEEGIDGMVYGEKVVWDGGKCSALVRDTGPNDPNHNVAHLDLSEAQIEALVEEARSLARVRA